MTHIQKVNITLPHHDNWYEKRIAFIRTAVHTKSPSSYDLDPIQLSSPSSSLSREVPVELDQANAKLHK